MTRPIPYPPREWTAEGPHIPLLSILDATARAAWSCLIAAHPELQKNRPSLAGFDSFYFADATLDSIRALLLELDSYVQYLAEEQQTKAEQS